MIKPTKEITSKFVESDEITNKGDGAAPLKKSVSVKPVHIKTYSTKSGAIVPSHVAKRRKSEENDPDSEAGPPQIDWNAIQKKRKDVAQQQKTEKKANKIIKEEEARHIEKITTQEPKKVNASGTPRVVVDGDHTSSVLFINDEYGRGGFFKPVEGEAWATGKGTDTTLFKSGITDDRLGRREVLASSIGEDLRVDGIVKTEWSHVTHSELDPTTNQQSTKDLGPGALQRDASATLIAQGYQQPKVFAEAVGEIKKEMIDRGMSSSQKVEDSPAYTSMIKSALKNGGMDIAYFDYIIGNTDRHGNNFLVGTNQDGVHKFAGIDHGLSFPNSTTFNKTAFTQTSEGLWDVAISHGKDIECSDSFKQAISNGDVHKQIKQRLDASVLTDSEKKGVVDRLEHVRQQLKYFGSLNGKALGSIVDRNFEAGTGVPTSKTPGRGMIIDRPSGARHQGSIDGDLVAQLRKEMAARRAAKV